MKKINLAVTGCLGRMGQQIIKSASSDKNFKLVGTVSDGDIRKSILKGIDLNSNISKIYNKKSFHLIQNNFNKEEVKEIFLKERYNLIPVISKSKKVVDIQTINEDVLIEEASSDEDE